MTDAAPIKVTFFGDSTCVGQGVSLYRGWVTRVAQSLDALGREMGRDIVVSNQSVNGRTTRQALEDMPYHIQNAGVDILIIQYGLNDCNYWQTDRGLPRVSKAAYIANIQEIVDRAQRFGGRNIFVNGNHPTTRDHTQLAHTDFTYEASNRAYNDALRQWGSEQDAPIAYNDIETGFRNYLAANPDVALSDCLLEDELHLSEVGHSLYFDMLYPPIREAVKSFANKEADAT